MKKPVLPGLAPRIAYSANGQTICDTPGSDSITRNGSPVVPAVVLASSASMRTAAICGFVATIGLVDLAARRQPQRVRHHARPAGTSTGTSAAA